MVAGTSGRSVGAERPAVCEARADLRERLAEPVRLDALADLTPGAYARARR